MREWFFGTTPTPLWVMLVYFGVAAFYLWQAIKLRRERRRLRKDYDDYNAHITKCVEMLKVEANQKVVAYVARCHEWAADPWDPRWDKFKGNIFHDLDQRFDTKH